MGEYSISSHFPTSALFHGTEVLAPRLMHLPILVRSTRLEVISKVFYGPQGTPSSPSSNLLPERIKKSTLIHDDVLFSLTHSSVGAQTEDRFSREIEGDGEVP